MPQIISKRLNKLFIIIIYCAFACGFTLLGSATWDNSAEEPTIWIKPCADILNNNFTNNLNSTNDSLGTTTSITGTVVMQSIYDDYIKINSSYLRLAPYPADPNNPGTPVTGDTTFTKAKAEKRTIELCFSSPGGFKGGYASPTASGKQITACTIVIKDTYKSDLRLFLAAATHEIGHCLGLDHPMETRLAVMSYFNEQTTQYRLQIDDRMGMVFLYPNKDVNAKEINTFGLSCARK